MIELVQDEIGHLADDPLIQKNPLLSANVLQQRTQDIFTKMDNPSPGVLLCQNYFNSLSEPSTVTIDSLQSQGISSAQLEEYYQYAKFKYDSGMYSEAEILLTKYLSVSQPQTTSVLGALWGRLACRILEAKWELSLSDFYAVKEAIESRSISPMDQLRQRGWLMHWGLLVLLNQREGGADALFDFYSEKIYLQTLENLCPWLLRYLLIDLSSLSLDLLTLSCLAITLVLLS
jgi:hypothetical protein